MSAWRFGPGRRKCSKLRAWLALLHGSTEETHQPHPSPSSGNTDGNRASQLRHAVQDMDGDPNFCATALVLVEAQPIADDLFISTDHGLHTASFSIARRLLPCDPAPPQGTR